MAPRAAFTAHARTDERDWLIEADEPLAGLQLRAGGELPGVIVSPGLLELVRKARLYRLTLSRAIRAQDDAETVTAWVEVSPDNDGAGCRIALANWQAAALQPEPGGEIARRRVAVIRQVSELTARLGPGQELLAVEAQSPDLAATAARLRAAIGRPWTEIVPVEGQALTQPLHWRLLDEAKVTIEDSAREWCAHLVPLGAPELGSAGFELHLVANHALGPEPDAHDHAPEPLPGTAAIGREIAPVLRQPIARIIANAETIRTQLAGPLADEYSNYAADIASAGEHLLALLDDLVALEVVEDEQFAPAPDRIDLADVARRAAGILGVRARERGIEVTAPGLDERAPAIGEFRRVLQILLNLLGNAIRYTPEGAPVALEVTRDGERARIVVADRGEGLAPEQQARVFDKFERLGRSGDGGSGLGLYISRRLARAMDGDLTVASEPGEGTRFTLELPSDPDA